MSIQPITSQINQQWTRLELPPAVLDQHPDFAKFLIDSGLALSIVGFRETSQDPHVNTFMVDRDGHPLLKVQGVWVRWETIAANLIYDPVNQQIKSRHYPGNVVQVWSHVATDGLVPVDYLNHERLTPVHRLNRDDYESVMLKAREFYRNYAEVDVGIPKDCIFQLVTTPRRQFLESFSAISENPIFNNLADNFDTHIGIRIIDREGRVYSTGIEMPLESQKFLAEKSLTNIFSTVPAKISKVIDYEELRLHSGRLVTSIPMSSQRAARLLDELNKQGTIRWQFLRQNSSKLARFCMQRIGYDVVDNRTSVKEMLFSSIPNGEDLPLIGPLLGKIKSFVYPLFEKISTSIPDGIKKAYAYFEWSILFIPSKIITIFINIVLLGFGGGKMMIPLKPGQEEDEFFDNQRIINFSTLIRWGTDLLKEETQVVYHSKQFIDWQREQPSTFIEPPSIKPKMAIVPPVLGRVS